MTTRSEQHLFVPDTHGRDVCDFKTDIDGRLQFCGRPRREHVEELPDESLKADPMQQLYATVMGGVYQTIVGGIYAHYKGPLYLVDGIEWESDNDRPRVRRVRYISQDKLTVNSRTETHFHELVDTESGKAVIKAADHSGGWIVPGDLFTNPPTAPYPVPEERIAARFKFLRMSDGNA